MHDIGKIYNETLDTVYGYVFKRIGNRDATEDIVSDTYMTLIDVIEKYDDTSKMTTFIIGIAVNKIRQYWQKHSDNVDIDDLINTIPAADSHEREEAFDQKLQQMLPRIMGELDNRDRDVLDLRFLKSYSVKETAGELNLSEANVRVIQHRAIQKCQTIAEQLYE